MPSLCEFEKKNGTKCKKSPGHHTIQGRCLPFMKEKSTCSACIPDLWKDEIVVQEGSALVSVRNTKHVDGINDLSRHQDVLVRINALLKGNDIEEKVVADALLDLLQTPEWQFDPKKPKSFPYMLYLRRKQSLSLENTVAALVMMKKCHQDHKDKLKARQKDRIASGRGVVTLQHGPNSAGSLSSAKLVRMSYWNNSPKRIPLSTTFQRSAEAFSCIKIRFTILLVSIRSAESRLSFMT
jgi:hypothetical protein